MIRHNCGFAVAHTLHDVYGMIRALQHRGREAAGIAAIGDQGIDVIKWAGTVDRVDLGDLHRILTADHHTFLAHVRYKTKGSEGDILEDAHPHVIGGRIEHRGDHIIIRDCDAAIVHNGHVNLEYLEKIDEELLNTGCDSERVLHYAVDNSLRGLLRNIPDAYTAAIASREWADIALVRGRTGIKPGVLGVKDGKVVAASEDVAFRKNGAQLIEDLTPGSLYLLDKNGEFRKERITEPTPHHCFFEWNYIGNIDSVINGVSVRRVRQTLGRVLAEQTAPDDIDFVTYLPRCPESAARVYAEKIGKPFIPVFYKLNQERAFQGSNIGERANSIAHNLHLIDTVADQIRGKKGVIIDDSIVRGNNLVRARELMYEEARVAEAYLISYTPKIGIIGEDGIPRGCTFGVDMPPDDHFIARERSDAEISVKAGMPVRYLEREAMLRAFEDCGLDRKTLCTFCIGGPHPYKNIIPIGK